MTPRRFLHTALSAVLVALFAAGGFVVTTPEAVAQATDYPRNFDDDLLVTSSEGRQLNSFTLTGANSGVSTITLDNSGQNLVYRNMISSEAAVQVGESVSVSIDYTGSYMHAYLYVDFNGDGQFDTTLNADGTPATGSELVSYTYYNGKNSLGQTTSENVSANGVTFSNAFTIPSTQTTGRFRARLKIDWNNIDPAGQYSEGGDNIDKNGGYIVDFILKVYSTSCHLDLVTPNGSLVGSGNSGVPASATYKSALTLLPVPVTDGYSLESITVRHGYNLDGTAIDAHGNPQWSEYSIDATTSAFTIAKDSVDGDLRVTANFTQAAGARYYLMFSDDFNGEDGSQPSSSKWVRHGIASSVWNRFNATTTAGQKETGYIKDGKFVALCKPNTYSDEYMADGTTVKDMISGAINSSSSFNFKYGKVEARVKTNTLRGNFPAFWLMPNNGSPGWPWCGEIDIWEAVDASNVAYQTIHSGWANTDNGGYGNSSNPRKSNSVSISQNEYHVYGLEWTEDMLKWYVDGKQVFSYAKSTSQDALDKYQWPFDKEFYIILNQSVGNGSWASAANTSWTYETDFDWVRVYQIPDVTVTYNYVLDDGTLLFTTTSEQPVGLPPEAPSSNLVTVTSYSSNTETVQYDGSTVVTVNCSVNLPFQVSTDTEEYWYAIDIYATDESTAGMGKSSTTVDAGTKSWLWRYGNPKAVVKSSDLAQNAQLTDDYLWKFKGNLLDGFTIYNKKAGDELPLYKSTTGNISCRMQTGTKTEQNLFHLVDNVSVDGTFSFIREGDTYYVHKDASSTDLKGTTSLDATCAMHFRPASEFVLSYYEQNYEGIDAAPEGALGTATPDAADYIAAAKTAATTLRSDAFDDDATAALVEANTGIGSNLISVPSILTGYYRLVNVAYGTTLSVKTVKDRYSNSFPISCTLTTDEARSDASSVIQLERIGTGAVKRYRLTTDGQYIGLTKQSDATALNTTDDGNTYVFTNTGKGKFTVFNYGGDDYAYLHCSVNQADGVVGWETDADASFWYVVPATEFDVALTTMSDGKAYGTTYLPFPLVGSTSGEFFTCELNEAGDAINATALSAAPAQTGLLLISSDNTTATLTIGATTDSVATILSGSLTTKSLSASTRPSYLFLGESDGHVGFYTATSGNLVAHSAYVPASAVTTTALPLANIVSGIGQTIVITPASADTDAPVYDLSGRRVSKVVKDGVYLQAGRKFIAK